MAFLLSPLFNGWQGFTVNGIPLVGGLLNTYAAGGVTPQATYTDSSGGTPNANPIVLDASGHPPFEIWLTANTAYKFVLTDALGLNTYSYDNVTAPFPSGTTIPGSGGPLTLPAGPDTLVGRATTDTLTNKTLSSPTTIGMPIAYAYLQTASQVCPGGFTTTIIFDHASVNTGSGYNAATGVFTAPSTGFYFISTGFSLGLSVTDVLFVNLLVTQAVGRCQKTYPAGALTDYFSTSKIVPMTAGDTAQVTITTVTANVTILYQPNGSFGSFFSVARIL